MLDLLERAPLCLGDEFEDEGESEQPDSREHIEREGQAEGEEEVRERRADAEVCEPEAEDGAAHTHAAQTQREQLGEQQSRHGGEEALLEEEEGDGQRQYDVGESRLTLKHRRENADGEQTHHGADLSGHDERAASVAPHHPDAEERGKDGDNTVRNVADERRLG